MKTGDHRRVNGASGDLTVGRLAKIEIGVKIATGIVRVVVPVLEGSIEVDRLHVASQEIVAPKGVAETHVTTVVPMDGARRGVSRATADQMVEVPKHAVPVTVVPKDEGRMGRVLVTVGRKDVAPRRVVPVTVVRIGVVPNIVVQAARVANILDGQVTDHTVIVVHIPNIVTAKNTDDQAVPNSAIVGQIIEAVSSPIVVRADRNSDLVETTIAGLGIAGSDAAKDADRVEANLLIAVLKAGDLLTTTAIITDSVIDGLNTMPRAVQAAVNSGIMVDRANTISDIMLIVVPRAADLLTTTATTGDSVAEALNTTLIVARAEVSSGTVEDRNITVVNIMVLVRIFDIMAARVDMSLLIMKDAVLVDHNSRIATAGTTVVGARHAMLEFLIQNKLIMRNTVNMDVVVRTVRNRVPIGRPWKADPQVVARMAPGSVVVEARGGLAPVAPARADLVSGDILRRPKCWTLLTPTRMAS